MPRLLSLLVALAVSIGAAIAPAAAQYAGSAPLPNRGPLVNYIGNASSPTGSGTATRTWVGANIGTGTTLTNRRVIVAFANASSGLTVSSCTIATISCDQVNNVGSGATLISFMSVVVPSGTSGDIAITFSGNDTAASTIQIYAVDNSLLYSKIPVIGFNSAGASLANSLSVAVEPGGFGISILNPASTLGSNPINVGSLATPANNFCGPIPDQPYSLSPTASSTGIANSNNINIGQTLTSSWVWTINSVASSLAYAAWR